MPDSGDPGAAALSEPAAGGRGLSGIAATTRDNVDARRIVAAGVAVIALGALLVRFWDLGDQPGGLYPDEAAEGVSAHQILTQPGYHPIFIDADGGREALYAYLVAIAFRFFGGSVFVLRSVAAAVGVLGVIAVWVAARRYGRVAALAAMAWAAGSLWLICVSRDGFRNVLTVAAGALALAALQRWGDRPTRVSAAFGGVATAAGFWVYAPLKLLPLLALLWLLWLRHVDRDRYRRVRATAGWALVAFAVVIAPVVWTAITDFSSYFGREASVAAVAPGVDTPDSFLVHELKTLGMFLVTGDPAQRHDVDALPLLGPLLFIPFALGVWRAWRTRHDHAHGLLLIGLVVFLLPPLLAAQGDAPHFLRSLGLAPYVAACIGLGCADLIAWGARGLGKLQPALHAVARPLAVAVCFAVLAMLGVVSIRAYLERPVTERYGPFSFADVQLAAAADHGPGTAVIVDGYNSQDVQFLDAADPPAIVSPGQRIADPAVYSLLVAPTRADIAAATDAATASRATVAAYDPGGDPVVWVVVPQPVS